MIIYSLIIRKEKSDKMEAKATYGGKWLLSSENGIGTVILLFPPLLGPHGIPVRQWVSGSW